MKKITRLFLFGAVLIAGAASVLFAGALPPAAQSSTSAKPKPKSSASSSSSKSRKRRHSVAARPKGQKAPTSDRVKEIQAALKREGSYDGEPNGRLDEATVSALKKFQDKNGLSANGKIDAQSLEKLGLGSETAGKGAPVPVAGAAPTPPPAPNSAQ
jgi:peptidoglycan hydrolase-like protein with peptidoglycan-binding domain